MRLRRWVQWLEQHGKRLYGQPRAVAFGVAVVRHLVQLYGVAKSCAGGTESVLTDF